MIETVGVIGAGTMGAGIAEVVMKAGVDTVVVELDPAAAEAGRARIEASLDKAVSRGKLDAAAAAASLGRLTVATDLGELAGADLVIEVVVENLAVKAALFADLDRVTRPGCILATNTSSIAIVDLGMATTRPDQVLGVHFFNPATVQPLVELIPSLATDPTVVDEMDRFCSDTLGKQTIRARDRAGFIANRLLVPYLLAAIRLFDDGLGTREDLDRAMKLGCAHPMGPLELSDLIGLDTIASIADVLYGEFRDASYAAPPLLRRMVAAGHLGRKTSRGFYDY